MLVITESRFNFLESFHSRLASLSSSILQNVHKNVISQVHILCTSLPLLLKCVYIYDMPAYHKL